MSDTPRNPLEGLNELSLGPAWARDKAEKSAKKTHYSQEREYKPRRDDRRDDRRGSNDRGERRQGGGDRRQASGGRRTFNNRRDNRDDRREEIQPAEGVNVGLIPEKSAIQAICKEIHQVARVYPLFDIAQTILSERNRLRAAFEINEKKPAFYRCKHEDALFLTKEEALRHFLQADWRSRFVEESTVEIDPPKGNFQSVARCGISGEWLGPPNFHTYQTEIRRIHRERFSHMPFEVYSAKVRTERSEEAVNEWLESMKTQTRWRILSDEEIEAKTKEQEAPAPAEAAPAATTPEPTPVAEETPEEQTAQEEPAVAEASEPEISAESATTPEPEETPEPETASEKEAVPEPEAEEKSDPAPEIKWITDRAEAERAILTEVIEKAYHSTRKAKVSAAIVGKNLSPGLLVRLRSTGNHHRKHPAILIPTICKALEAEHMAVFKRKGKLYTGPTRPQAIAADAVLAPRPAEMVTWIRENAPAKLEGLWKAVLPEGATAPPSEYAADLFWLLQQGHILLYIDDTLVVQEKPKPQEPKKPKKKAAKKVATVKKNQKEQATDARAAEEKQATEETPAPDSTSKAEEAATPVIAVDETSTAEQGTTADSEPATEETPESESPTSTEEATPETTEEESPVEIITDALKDVAETVADAASKLIANVTDPSEPSPEPSEEPTPDSSTEK